MDEATGSPVEGSPVEADGDALHTSEARLVLAESLRRLGNALVGRQPDDDLLRRITEQVDGFVPQLLAAPPRPHGFHVHDAAAVQPPPDGPGPGRHDMVSTSTFQDSVVSGLANPMGVAARLWRDGDEAVCQVTLGTAFEGAPGRAHGGIVAALIDETMGVVTSISGTPAFTGRLTVTYRAPTPVRQPLEIRARLAGRSGRKLTITAEVRAEGQLLVEAEALFIAVDLDHFFEASRGNGRLAGEREGE